MGPDKQNHTIKIEKLQEKVYDYFMTILGIETSCDDTGVALIKDGQAVLNLVSSQIEIHRPYGGVYPMLAKREHEKNLPILLKEVKSFDAVAVTVGPGLEPCLWVGINKAVELAQENNVPLYTVNHLRAHIDIVRWQNPNIELPAIALIVSGGHTQIILVKSWDQLKIIGETRDDAAGECFDKTARILGLDYPGGPAIAAKAKLTTSMKYELPRPMIHQKNLDFSFSGLKTAVLYSFQDKSEDSVIAMAKEIQNSIAEVLAKKTKKAVEQEAANSIIMGGGVTANEKIRQEIRKIGLPVFTAPTELCTDNGLMVAVSAYLSPQKHEIKANGNLRI